MGFALSKYPHFNSAYLVKVRFSLDLAVANFSSSHKLQRSSESDQECIFLTLNTYQATFCDTTAGIGNLKV